MLLSIAGLVSESQVVTENRVIELQCFGLGSILGIIVSIIRGFCESLMTDRISSGILVGIQSP